MIIYKNRPQTLYTKTAFIHIIKYFIEIVFRCYNQSTYMNVLQGNIIYDNRRLAYSIGDN